LGLREEIGLKLRESDRIKSGRGRGKRGKSKVWFKIGVRLGLKRQRGGF
jgi:hypothetical protein